MHTEHRYPLLTMEWLLTHGFAEAPLVKTPYKLPVNFAKLLAGKSVTHRALKSMVGLGWHAGSKGPWMMYLLASVETRSPANPNRTPSLPPGADTDDVDSEVIEVSSSIAGSPHANTEEFEISPRRSWDVPVVCDSTPKTKAVCWASRLRSVPNEVM